MPGRLSVSQTGPASKPGTAWTQRLWGSDSVITEMSAGLKDTSRGPEGGVEERERGEKGPTFVGVLFPLNCPSMQCESVLPLQMFFINVNIILLREISYFNLQLY